MPTTVISLPFDGFLWRLLHYLNFSVILRPCCGVNRDLAWLYTKGGSMRGYRQVALSGLVLGLSLVFVLVFQVTAEAADEGALVDYINQERLARGLPALAYSPDLSSGALLQAQENAACQCLSHAGQHYAAAENVTSAPTAWDAYQNWLGSAFHSANMFNPSHTSVGVGYAQDENGNGYYALNFA
jgi:uncharacterized protein YkwD